MASTIDIAFVRQFEDNLRHLSQQQGSRLRETVMQEMVTGKSHDFERLGKTAALPDTTRHGDTPIIDVPHSRRRVNLVDRDWGALIDDKDRVRLLIEPTSAYAENAVWSLGRDMDDIIIAAAMGNSTSIDASGTTSNIALPTTQIVDEDFGAADSNLTIEKLIEARRILMRNNVNMNEDLFFVANASALASLLNEAEIQSIDTNTVRALVAGQIDSFMGFKFIHTEQLLGTADGTDTDPVQCFAFARSGMALALGRDISARISERDDKKYSTQVYASMTVGAVRVEEEKVVQVQCVQSA